MEADAGVAVTTALTKPIADMSCCIERKRQEARCAENAGMGHVPVSGLETLTPPSPALSFRDCSRLPEFGEARMMVL
jgi:hypothetical protein